MTLFDYLFAYCALTCQNICYCLSHHFETMVYYHWPVSIFWFNNNCFVFYFIGISIETYSICNFSTFKSIFHYLQKFFLPGGSTDVGPASTVVVLQLLLILLNFLLYQICLGACLTFCSATFRVSSRIILFRIYRI